MLPSHENNSAASATKAVSETPGSSAPENIPNKGKSHSVFHVSKTTLQILVFLLTVYILVRYWHTSPIIVCPDDQECKHKEVNQQVSSILHQSLKAVMVVLILIQLVYLFDINLTPVVATFGVIVAALGFTVSDPLHDYVMGICLALSSKLKINTKVNIVLYGQTGKQGPIYVTNLSPLTVDGFDDKGNRVYIRYSYIQAIEITEDAER